MPGLNPEFLMRFEWSFIMFLVVATSNKFILSGSLVPLEPAQAGDKFRMNLKGVGTCEINFI